MFVVTKEMNISEEIKKRAERCVELRAEMSILRENAMMSDDRYMINNRDRELPQYQEIQRLQAEIQILNEGYIDPELEAKASKMYFEYCGGDFATAGPSVQKGWRAIAAKA